MTHTSRPQAEEIARIRAVVDRTPLPPIVTGYDIELDERDDEPLVWIIFKTDGSHPRGSEEVIARGDALRALKDLVQHDLREEIDGRYPLFRFAVPERAINGGS